ncbi:acyloxyacyl hydrolase [Desulfobacterota bacterium M19]
MKNKALFFVLVTALVSLPLAANAARIGDSKWVALGGYGFTHTNLGRTKVWVDTAFLALGYERVASREFGPSLLKGYYSVRVEVPVHYIIAPHNGWMTGVNFIGLWTLTDVSRKYKPYFLAGGGPVYIGPGIYGMSKHLNGNYMFGMGIDLDAGLPEKIKLEYRFNHISNGGQKEPNVPLNSSRLLVGFSF